MNYVKSLKLSDKLHLFITLASFFTLLMGYVGIYFNANHNANTTAIIIAIGVFSLAMIIASGLIITSMVTKPIYKVIDDLNAESAEAAAASSQVEAASHQLAEASLEEASSMQETSSTLEETSSMIQQNNENTTLAAALSKQATQSAEKSNHEMEKMVDLMEKLEQSSSDISKIVKVIDEIAFQTNILSLNAAVEAAHAGEAGKGFAVVAGEVRNLAQRSAEAAKETTVIIENNIKLATEGVEMAKDVEESLIQIDEESKKVSNLVHEISIASEEQARGIHEIHKAVSQMEEAISSNAQTAEECAAASKELSIQSDEVQEVVDNLTSMVNGGSIKEKKRKEKAEIVKLHHSPLNLTHDFAANF